MIGYHGPSCRLGLNHKSADVHGAGMHPYFRHLDVGVLSETTSHPSLPCASVFHLCNGGNSISKVMHINTYRP